MSRNEHRRIGLPGRDYNLEEVSEVSTASVVLKKWTGVGKHCATKKNHHKVNNILSYRK